MGSGFALDAIIRFKNNRALKQMNRFGYSQFKDVIINTKAKYHHFVDRSNLSEEQLFIYKRKIKNRIIKERIKLFTKSMTVTIILGFMIYAISSLLYHYFTG